MCAGIIVSVSDSASIAGTATLVNATLNLFSATGSGTFECYGVCNLSGTVGPSETVVLGTGNQILAPMYFMRMAQAMVALLICSLTLCSFGGMELLIH